MRVVSNVRSCKKFWQVINGHVINPTLHWAKKMMVEMGNVDCLIFHKVICLPTVRVVISNNTGYDLVNLSTKGWVKPFNGNLPIILLNYEGIGTENTCVSM
jgi:hypothetical protein